MRVLHVIDSSGVWGAEKMLFELIDEQRFAGIEAVALSIGKTSEGKKPIEEAMDALQIPYMVRRLSFLPSISSLHRLARDVRAEGYDIIHSHGYKGNVLFGLLLRPWLSQPVIATIHGWVTQPGARTKLRLYEYIDSRAIRKLDAIVLVSETMKEHPWLRSYVNKSAPKVYTISNGIRQRRVRDDRPLSPVIEAFMSGGRVIGSVGRLSDEKGFRYLVDAFASLRHRYTDVKLLLVGDGARRAALERQIAELKLDAKVMITGYIEEASRLMDRMDVYVSSSLSEGMPITLLEAMRAGTPIVATRVSSIPEILQNGGAGVLVEPGSAPALALGIETVLTDPRGAAARASVAKTVFRREYSSGVMSERYAQVYRSLL